jgi:hypothetical protein
MLPDLPIADFKFEFRMEGRCALPAYAGSAWRGALGHALKRAVCVVRDTACADCMLYRTCVYPYLFETPPPQDSAKMRRYDSAPHPYALLVDAAPDAGPAYTLGLTLFGRAHRYLPYLIHALEKAGKQGIGGKRQLFELTQVVQADPGDASAWRKVYRPGQALTPRPSLSPALPPVPQSLAIKIETPLRLRNRERYVTPESFRFADLFGTLLRRISMLTHFHADAPLETDFAGLTQKARAVELLDADLHWQDWTRYSSRQQAEMQMGGLLGCFGLDSASIEEFWPYLWLGQWTLVGKAATMGLGRYRIVAASLPHDTDGDQ